MGAGPWPVAVGRPVAGGRWPLAAGCWAVTAGRWPLAGGRWPVAIREAPVSCFYFFWGTPKDMDLRNAFMYSLHSTLLYS